MLAGRQDAVVGADQFAFGIAAELAELGIDRLDPPGPVGDRDNGGSIERLALKVRQRHQLLELAALQQAAAVQRSQLAVEAVAFLLARGPGRCLKCSCIPLNCHRFFPRLTHRDSARRLNKG
jgi:hypothetical protein